MAHKRSSLNPYDYNLTDREMADHKAERADQGFSWWDWTIFDRYIALVIADACQKFRLEGHGKPGDCRTLDEWHGVLLRIEEPLRAYADAYDQDLHEKDMRVAKDEADRAMRLFARYFRSMWC